MTVLILGGTGEARSLATTLVERGVAVISSLAGRVALPALPEGDVRVGGFGGIDGLVEYLQVAAITAIVDATHPFAATISAHAYAAAQRAGVPLLRLERSGWQDHPDADRWTWVPDLTAARIAAADCQRPFVTTGRRSLEAFAPWSDRQVLVRVVDPPAHDLPLSWTVLIARGPYEIDSEKMIMVHHGVDCVITKDSGGSLTSAKLDAAAALDLPVVVVQRPARVTMSTVHQPAEAVDWVLRTTAGSASPT